MSGQRKPQGTLWVCIECMLWRENRDSVDVPPGEPAPWTREPDTDVTLGLMSDAHLTNCPQYLGDEGECIGCDRSEFSHLDCEGCGSELAGSRHAYTWWSTDDEAATEAPRKPGHLTVWKG